MFVVIVKAIHRICRRRFEKRRARQSINIGDIGVVVPLDYYGLLLFRVAVHVVERR